MAKAQKPLDNELPPKPRDREAFGKWLARQRREWSVVLAGRVALRALPQIGGSDQFLAVALTMFRASAVARFIAKYPNRAITSSSVAAAAAAAATRAATTEVVAIQAATNNAVAAAASVAYAAAAATAVSEVVAHAADVVAYASNVGAYAASADAAVTHDAKRLHDRSITAEALAAERLWPDSAPPEFAAAWLLLKRQLNPHGHHWQVWIDWYENAVLQEPYHPISESQVAAFTDIPGELPWGQGAEAVNMEIKRRLAGISIAKIPDQSPAPVRVEERDGRISKSSDSESAIAASERDFKAWRDPVVDHIEELTASDFAKGTNHGRVRDRLMALDRLLPGEITEVKDRQFRIGYEIERFDGLVAAYRIGGDDMPLLNAAQLEDLDRLCVALKIGIGKLERWSEFRKRANESTAGEADADREIVGDALDEMAAIMEQRPQYFDPQLPETFRFLSEAVRDPRGATKTVVYGAVKSAENLMSYLGQRALGIGKKSAEAVEQHISKAVATVLVTGLGSAALDLSGALPQAWPWLKLLLAALRAGG